MQGSKLQSINQFGVTAQNRPLNFPESIIRFWKHVKQNSKWRLTLRFSVNDDRNITGYGFLKHHRVVDNVEDQIHPFEGTASPAKEG